MRFKNALAMERAWQKELGERAFAAPGEKSPRVLTVGLESFYPKLKGPSAIIPDLRAIGPGHGVSLDDACRALQRIVWNVECKIVQIAFALSIRICHGKNPRLRDLSIAIVNASPRRGLCRTSQ
jgi:hypothetical protein